MGFKMKGWKAYDTTDHSNNTPDGRAGSSAFQQGYIRSRPSEEDLKKIKDIKIDNKLKSKRNLNYKPQSQANKNPWGGPKSDEKPGRGGVIKPTKRQLIDMSKKFKKPKSSPMKQGVIRPMPKNWKGTEAEWRAQENANIKKFIERRNKNKKNLKEKKDALHHWKKIDKDSLDVNRVYGDKKKSPLKKDKMPKFTPGIVLRELKDQYKRAFGKGWRDKYKKKK